jgi:hypothetical protein
MAETPFARRAARASSHRGNDPSGDTRFNAQQLGCRVPREIGSHEPKAGVSYAGVRGATSSTTTRSGAASADCAPACSASRSRP